MNIEGLFPGRPESRPKIYAYAETRTELAGLHQVGGKTAGYTMRERRFWYN